MAHEIVTADLATNGGLVAEILAEAMLGPVSTEANWLLMTVSTGHWCEPEKMKQLAEEILQEIRSCPPAEGFEKVEVPGEREREHRIKSDGKISVPKKTWTQICNLSNQLFNEDGTKTFSQEKTKNFEY